MIVLRITVVIGLMILAVVLVVTLLTSSYVLHVTNQTAIIDPTIAGVTGAIRHHLLIQVYLNDTNSK